VMVKSSDSNGGQHGSWSSFRGKEVASSAKVDQQSTRE
jgi:hypothetical protein